MHRYLTFLALGMIAGCASNHDLATGPNHFGGGFTSKEVKPGFFRIVARTNGGPWSSFSEARRSWADVANAACGEGKWKEMAIKEAAFEPRSPMGILSYVTTERTGYALCHGAATTEAEAESYSAPSADWPAM